MDEQELMGNIRKVTAAAMLHVCTPCCPQEAEYAEGAPPAGWQGAMARLAAGHGYALHSSTLPEDIYGTGCSGVTSGRWTSGGIAPCEIHISPRRAEATRFAVTCHEMTHMLLNHPPQDEYQAVRMALEAMERDFRGKPRESFEHEVQAHLSAGGAVLSSGMKLRTPHLCYLRERIEGHSRPVTSEEEYAAFSAARTLMRALEGK